MCMGKLKIKMGKEFQVFTERMVNMTRLATSLIIREIKIKIQ